VARRCEERLISTVAMARLGRRGPPPRPVSRPHSPLVDADDNIYVSTDNHRVRKIDSRTGRITSLVGNGRSVCPKMQLGREQPFTTPQGPSARDAGIVSSGQSVWRLDVQSGKICRAAGTGKQGLTGDGGDPLRATFDGPRGVWLTSAGVLCVAEGENNVIRAFDTARGTIRTIAGAGPKQDRYTGDGGPL
jgi:DNA-binding beta-propeller fold protein YncE